MAPISLDTPHKVSIVVPCFNEARTIEETLQKLLTTEMPGWEREVIIVDDASTDGTRDILKRYEDKAHVIYCEKNGGKGTAVRRGLSEATGAYMLIQDADLEYDPADIPALLRALEGGTADVVYGSRTMNPLTPHGSFIARTGAWAITQEMNMFYRLSLTDVWTCYKLFPREAADAFVAGRFESELLFTAALARLGYRFVEVPISYAPRTLEEGKKIRYRDGVVAITTIFTDWVRHLW